MSTPESNASVDVFYLLRWSNPFELTQRFAESYLNSPAGSEHTLTLICKGFQDDNAISNHQAAFRGAATRILRVSDAGLDCGAYRKALDNSSAEYCLFLNSYSVIQAPTWLAHFLRCAGKPKVGVVSASGSYESSLTGLINELRHRKSLNQRVRGLPRAVKYWAWFPPFPNPHIRTNAFLLRRDVGLRIEWPGTDSRMDALRFESGRRSLTRQLQKFGYEPVIVGRDGGCYEVADWPSSRTFRLEDQGNMLINDNRTAEFELANNDRRRQLKTAAWGSGDAH